VAQGNCTIASCWFYNFLLRSGGWIFVVSDNRNTGAIKEMESFGSDEGLLA
jgi:hypothetical protein